jgi:hypothetical protein
MRCLFLAPGLSTMSSLRATLLARGVRSRESIVLARNAMSVL